MKNKMMLAICGTLCLISTTQIMAKKPDAILSFESGSQFTVEVVGDKGNYSVLLEKKGLLGSYTGEVSVPKNKTYQLKSINKDGTVKSVINFSIYEEDASNASFKLDKNGKFIEQKK